MLVELASGGPLLATRISFVLSRRAHDLRFELSVPQKQRAGRRTAARHAAPKLHWRRAMAHPQHSNHAAGASSVAWHALHIPDALAAVQSDRELGLTAVEARERLLRVGANALLAICAWFNVLNCRSATRSALTLDLLRNKWLLAGLLAGNALQIAVVFWSPLASIFHTVPFDLGEALALGAVGSIVLWAEELRKLVVRRRLRSGA